MKTRWERLREIYRKIRKPTAPPGKYHESKSRYRRDRKRTRDYMGDK